MTDTVDDKHKGNQLHGSILHKGERLKVSFIEDAYFYIYPTTLKTLGGLKVRAQSLTACTIANSGPFLSD